MEENENTTRPGRSRTVWEESVAIRRREGLLTKQGHGASAFGRKTWKVRYFVLDNGILSYAEDEKCAARGEFIKSVKLCKSDRVERYLASGDKRNLPTFQLVTRGRTFYFIAESEMALWVWIDELRAHINFANEKTRVKTVGSKEELFKMATLTQPTHSRKKSA